MAPLFWKMLITSRVFDGRAVGNPALELSSYSFFFFCSYVEGRGAWLKDLPGQSAISAARLIASTKLPSVCSEARGQLRVSLIPHACQSAPASWNSPPEGKSALVSAAVSGKSGFPMCPLASLNSSSRVGRVGD